MSHIGEALQSQTALAKMARFPGWHARIPATVLLDQKLDPKAKCVFAVLCLNVYQGNVAYIGTRLIAQLLTISQRTVARKLLDLEVAGHITIQPGKRGQRSFYVLNSPTFGQKQRSGAREIDYGPSGGKRLVSAPKNG